MSTRPVLSLVTGFEELFDTIEDQWQERALCAQTDPEAFFPEKRRIERGKQNGSASVVKFVTSASSTRSRTTNGSESGEGCPSASVGDSSGGSSDLLLNRFCQRRWLTGGLRKSDLQRGIAGQATTVLFFVWIYFFVWHQFFRLTVRQSSSGSISPRRAAWGR